jgi:two-component system, chemotaxis family, sensor kinase CheA
MSIDLKRFRGIFFGESLDGLAAAERDLLVIERAIGQRGENGAVKALPDASVQSLFRAIHSVKGSAGSLGFDDIGALSHDFETVLDALRSGGIAPDKIDIDLLFAGVDALRAMVLAERDQTEPVAASRVSAVRARLAHAASLAQPVMVASASPLVAAQPKPVQQGAQTSAQRTVQILFKPNASFREGGHDPEKYLRILSGYGEMQVEGDDVAGYRIALVTDASDPMLRAEFEWVEDLCVLEFGQAPSAPLTPKASAPAEVTPPPLDMATPEVAHDGLSRLSVASAQLDSLLEIAGNLVTSSAQLNTAAQHPALREHAALQQGLGAIKRHIKELQDVALSLRLIPAQVLFSPFDRVVRDVARRLNKEVRLVTAGDGQLIDKSLVEALADPLSHLVRNAVDHGVENRINRASSGKASIATITLSVTRQGGQVLIGVQDDGAGIDPAAIRQIAIARGFVDAQEVRTNEAWTAMIFAPGFSTAAGVSDLSGRGVGLDAVLQAVNRLGGDLSVSSHPGQGTRFELRFRLTMAIVDAIVIENAGVRYVLATDSVAACLKAESQHMRVMWDQTFFDWHGTMLPCAKLESIYGRTQAQLTAPAQQAEQKALLVLRAGEGHIALLVDRVLDNTQVVVKNLEKNLFAVPLVSAMTTLGDGTMVPILDVRALVSRVAQTGDNSGVADSVATDAIANPAPGHLAAAIGGEQHA